MVEPYILGVDIGTTFTAAAVRRGSLATPCTLGNRTASIPTVVAVLTNGDVHVGESAERRVVTDPSAIAREFKRRLGDTTPLRLSGHEYTPQALMAIVLRWVIRRVSDLEDMAPAEVVLTYPAHYGPYKVGLMKEVARLADLTKVRLLSEPESAAVAYATKARLDVGRSVAVYDFGGGTFDAALVRRTGSSFELLGGADGIDRLGGMDIDDLVLDHVLDEAGVRDPSSVDIGALHVLRQRCRDAKEALATDERATILVGVPAQLDRVTLTQRDLARMIRSRVVQTVEILKRAIRNSGTDRADLDRVLLVGGSSRLPEVADYVRTTLALPIASDIDPKTAVCVGAALSSAPTTRAGGNERERSKSEDSTSVVGSDADAATRVLPVRQVAASAYTRRRLAAAAVASAAVAGIVVGVVKLTSNDTFPNVAGTRQTAPSSAVITQPPFTAPPSTSPATTPSVTVASSATIPAIIEPDTAQTAPESSRQVSTTPSEPAATDPTTPPTDPHPSPTEAKSYTDAVFFQDSVAGRLLSADYFQSTNTVHLTWEATNPTRVPVDPSAIAVGMVVEGQEIAGTSSGQTILPAGTATIMTSISVPDTFVLGDSVMFTGGKDSHRTLVNLSTGGVKGELPVDLVISGQVTTGPAAFVAKTAQLIPARCSSTASETLALAAAPTDEYSIVVLGAFSDKVPSASLPTFEFVLPSGTTRAASTAPQAATAGPADVPVCLSGLKHPLAGTYVLRPSVAAGLDGSVQVVVPPGVDPTPDTTPPAKTSSSGSTTSSTLASTGSTKPRSSSTTKPPASGFALVGGGPTSITIQKGVTTRVSFSLNYVNAPNGFACGRTSLSSGVFLADRWFDGQCDTTPTLVLTGNITGTAKIKITAYDDVANKTASGSFTVTVKVVG